MATPLGTGPFMPALQPISVWIACLAVLLNMLAAPWSRALDNPEMHLLLWGSFCSGNSSTAQHSPRLSRTIAQPAPAGDSMQHSDCCCCGHLGMTALPATYHRHALAQYVPATPLASPAQTIQHPRRHWPSLNPRASPHA